LMQQPFATFQQELSSLDETTPPTSVKALRSALGSMRDILDVFVYAYPPKFSTGDDKSKGDAWVKVRECVDDGYTEIGDFKDLADSGVNYTQKQEDKRRNVCLDWKADYVSHAQEYNSYILNASVTQLYNRDKSVLSPYFWANTPYKPSLKLTGVQNVALLAKGLVSEAIDGMSEWENLTDITGSKKQLKFHDYRKLIRGTYAVATFTSDVYITNPNCSISRSQQTVNTFYSMIGKVHDNIVAYDYNKENDHSKKAKASKKLVESMWESLKGWVTSNNPSGSLTCLQTSLVPIPQQ